MGRRKGSPNRAAGSSNVVIDPDEMRPPPDHLLVFDPGKTTGIVYFENGVPRKSHQINLDDLDEFLELNYELTFRAAEHGTVLYENFKLFSWKAKQQSGSAMEASQAIGMIRSFARRTKSSIYDQSPQIKPIAYKWAGVNKPKDHSKSHYLDAYVHGVYWMVKGRMMKVGQN